ncbi:MAG: DNA repair protein RecO [Bdellovibrionales bacterium]|nr:DNA repair protein RecO [Bdellovibrionales bacterium]
MKSQSYQCEGIVLRVTDYRDFDQIVTLYSKEFGKISAYAPSSRRSVKRFGGCFQAMAKLSFLASSPRSSEQSLWRLQQAEVKDLYFHHRENLFSLATLVYFCECITAFLPEAQSDGVVYEWLENVLSSYPSEKKFDQMFQFELELLSALGFRPGLFQCVECLSEFKDKKRRFFSFEKGGVMCDSCVPRGEGKMIESSPSSMSMNLSRLDFINWVHTFHDFLSFNSQQSLKTQQFRKEIMYASL